MVVPVVVLVKNHYLAQEVAVVVEAVVAQVVGLVLAVQLVLDLCQPENPVLTHFGSVFAHLLAVRLV